MIDRRKLIDAGGFAEVWEGTFEGSPCAAKYLKDPTNDDHLRRFRREVREHLHLQGSRLIKSNDVFAFIKQNHIVPVIARNVQLDNNAPWFAMPLAIESLSTYLARRHGPGEVRLFKEVCVGVAVAHQKGIIHRDIKPTNVLLYEIDHELCAAVSDFGIGRFKNRDTTILTPTDCPIGTAFYSSPEQETRDSEIDERSDVYSLGILLYEMLTGQRPTTVIWALVPPQYVDVVKKATQPNLIQRFQNVKDLLACLP